MFRKVFKKHKKNTKKTQIWGMLSSTSFPSLRNLAIQAGHHLVLTSIEPQHSPWFITLLVKTGESQTFSMISPFDPQL